jgi:hypothetical protein
VDIGKMIVVVDQSYLLWVGNEKTKKQKKKVSGKFGIVFGKEDKKQNCITSNWN